MPRFPQHEAEKGERQEHQPRGESSTPSGCGWMLCMWSGAQVCRGRTLHGGGCPNRRLALKARLDMWLSTGNLNTSFFNKNFLYTCNVAQYIPQCTEFLRWRHPVMKVGLVSVWEIWRKTAFTLVLVDNTHPKFWSFIWGEKCGSYTSDYGFLLNL